jgi:hypothetical protein
MAWKVVAAGFCAAVVAVTAFATDPADAAAKKKRHVVRDTRETIVIRGRAPARVTVPARSFLDPGTEVIPGDRKFMDYAIPPGYSPTSVIENTSAYHRSPLPGPFDLPGRNNPYPWNWCLGC